MLPIARWRMRQYHWFTAMTKKREQKKCMHATNCDNTSLDFRITHLHFFNRKLTNARSPDINFLEYDKLKTSHWIHNTYLMFYCCSCPTIKRCERKRCNLIPRQTNFSIDLTYMEKISRLLLAKKKFPEKKTSRRKDNKNGLLGNA
jgi:hypothetical protein